MTGSAGSEPQDDISPPTTDLRDRLVTAADRFTDRWAPLSRAVDVWTSHSRFDAALDRFAAVVRDAWIVRWLTTEPEPDPIVIDLRESRMLGPPLSVFDRLLPRLDAAGRTSRVQRAGRGIVGWAERYVVPAVSLLLLGYVVYLLATTWHGASPLWLAALAIAVIAGLLGLTVTESRDVLGRSRFARVAVALVAPPVEDDSRADARR